MKSLENSARKGVRDNDIGGDVWAKHYADKNQKTHGMAIKGQKTAEAVADEKKQVADWTIKAMEAGEKGDKKKEMFFLNKAAHLIQDTYNPAHTVRDEKGNIVKSNVYDKENRKIHTRDADAIYEEGYKAKSGTLKKEEVMAEKATEEYFNSYIKIRKEGNGEDYTKLIDKHFNVKN
jgi:hypothetical protein